MYQRYLDGQNLELEPLEATAFDFLGTTSEAGSQHSEFGSINLECSRSNCSSPFKTPTLKLK